MKSAAEVVSEVSAEIQAALQQRNAFLPSPAGRAFELLAEQRKMYLHLVEYLVAAGVPLPSWVTSVPESIQCPIEDEITFFVQETHQGWVAGCSAPFKANFDEGPFPSRELAIASVKLGQRSRMRSLAKQSTQFLAPPMSVF